MAFYSYIFSANYKRFFSSLKKVAKKENKNFLKMVLEACLESDKILVVGWDVAISDKGPVIIEGNRRPGFDIVQVLSGGRMDIVNNVLNCIDKINNNK